jgi:hypothetical protein
MWKSGPICTPVYFVPARRAFERLQFESSAIERMRCAAEKSRGFSALKAHRDKMDAIRRRLIEVHHARPFMRQEVLIRGTSVPCSPGDPCGYPAGCLVSNIAHFLTTDIPVAVLL